MSFMSPKEVNHTHVSKSDSALKLKVCVSFKVSVSKQISIVNVLLPDALYSIKNNSSRFQHKNIIMFL